MMHRNKTPELVVSALGTAALAVAFALWVRDETPDAASLCAAALSAGLMYALCLRFVPAWCDFWRSGARETAAAASEKERCLKIFGAILLWDCVILLLGFVLRRVLGYTENAGEYFNFWLCTDSQHYADIARDWYLSEGDTDRLVQLVFLPGYPVAVRLASYLTGSVLSAGLAVSALCYAGCGAALYKLLRLDANEKTALRGVKFFVLNPASFFFAAPMSESLFLLCTLLCVYLVRRGRFLAGSAFGAYASFTRSPGLILAVFVLFELVHRRARAKNYLALLIIPLGFAAYCIINYLVAGDAFKFMEYQSEHWGQRLGLFFGTAAYQTGYAIKTLSEGSTNFWGLWLPNLLAQLLALIIMLRAAKRLRASYTAYFIAYFAVTVGTTWLLSAPRYLAANFALPAALSRESGKRKTDICLTAASVLAFLAYFTVFLLRWQVW